MWWFVGGYLLTAVVFYAYIVMTAQEDPEAHEALGQKPGLSSAGLRHAGSSAIGASHRDTDKRAPRAA